MDALERVRALKLESAQIPVEDVAVLRSLGVADVTDAYVAGLNDSEVNKYLVAPRRQRQTIDSVREYVRSNAADRRSVLLGIFVDDRLRGTVRVHDLDPLGSATVGIALFDRLVWGRGIGAAVLRAVRLWAADLGLRELRAGIAILNIASARAFAAAGFEPDDSSTHQVDGDEVHTWICAVAPD